MKKVMLGMMLVLAVSKAYAISTVAILDRPKPILMQIIDMFTFDLDEWY